MMGALIVDWLSAAGFIGVCVMSLYATVCSYLINGMNNPLYVWVNVHSPLHLLALIPVHIIFLVGMVTVVASVLYYCGCNICSVKLSISSTGVDMTLGSTGDDEEDEIESAEGDSNANEIKKDN